MSGELCGPSADMRADKMGGGGGGPWTPQRAPPKATRNITGDVWY
jgi:hypothetical protein